MEGEQPGLAPSGWSWLIVGALLVGLLTGALGTAFRVALELADIGPPAERADLRRAVRAADGAGGVRRHFSRPALNVHLVGRLVRVARQRQAQ